MVKIIGGPTTANVKIIDDAGRDILETVGVESLSIEMGPGVDNTKATLVVYVEELDLEIEAGSLTRKRRPLTDEGGYVTEVTGPEGLVEEPKEV